MEEIIDLNDKHVSFHAVASQTTIKRGHKATSGEVTILTGLAPQNFTWLLLGQEIVFTEPMTLIACIGRSNESMRALKQCLMNAICEMPVAKVAEPAFENEEALAFA